MLFVEADYIVLAVVIVGSRIPSCGQLSVN